MNIAYLHDDNESLNCLPFNWILVDNPNDGGACLDPRNERIYPEIDADYLLRSPEWFDLVSRSTATRIHAHPSNLTMGLLARGDRSLAVTIAQRWARGDLRAVPWTQVAFAVRESQRGQAWAVKKVHVRDKFTDGDWQAFEDTREVFVYMSNRHEVASWDDVIYPRLPLNPVNDTKLLDVLRASFNSLQIFLEHQSEDRDSRDMLIANPGTLGLNLALAQQTDLFSRLPPAIGTRRWRIMAQLQDNFELIRKKYKLWERSARRAEERRQEQERMAVY